MTLYAAGQPITMYDIANNYVNEYMDTYAFQYSGNVQDLYNLGYFKGLPRYVGGAGPAGPSPGYFSSGAITMADFYSTDGNCNCNCICDCNCACNC